MADTEDNSSAPPPPEYQPKKVIYCGVCSLPPEYCEFGGTTSKCEQWLSKTHPKLHNNLYSEAAIASKLSTLSVEARARAEKDSAKKQAKAATAEAKENEKKQNAQVIIKRVERNKRKYVTEISGLEAFVDIKKVAKDMGKKFATGSSVTKGTGGLGDIIVVQGDLADDIEEWILDNYEEVPEDNLEIVEDKKKKSSAA